MATERVTMVRLRSAPQVNALIATIGLWMIFHHAAGWIWGYDPVSFPSLFSLDPVDVLGARVAQNSLGIIAVSLLVVVLLYLLFEYTRTGIAMRAASMNRRAAQLMGVNVGRVSLFAWGLATAISVVAGFLIAPLTFLDFEMMFAVLLKHLPVRSWVVSTASTALLSVAWSSACLKICLPPTYRLRSRTPSHSESLSLCSCSARRGSSRVGIAKKV